MTDNIITIADLTKVYGKKEVIHPVTMTVKKGEILAIIGPSGAGKSTLIRLLDGLELPTSGTISAFGTPLSSRTRRKLREKIGILFQKSILFDRTVFENVALGLSYRRLPRAEQKRRIDETLNHMGMADYAARRARTLSGGEGQRIAFARILVTRPEILLLDEPTANLDPLATSVLEEMILRENHENHTTIIINTHNQTQAQRLADRVAVLIDGTLMQTGTADEIWYQPADAATARFVGFQNIFPAEIVGNSAVAAPGFSVDVPPDKKINGPAAVLIRAEDILIGPASSGLLGTVTSLERRGAFLEVSVWAGVDFFVRMPYKEFGNNFAVGSRVAVSWKKDAAVVCRAG